MEITIALEAELPAVAALEAAEFSAPMPPDMLRRLWADPQGLVLCAREGEDLLGCVTCRFVLDEGEVGNLAVAPAYRRRGVGRALTRSLIAAARERGAAFLTLEVRESNHAARALYEQAGFQTVGVRKNYYERPREDGLLMTLTLPEEERASC